MFCFCLLLSNLLLILNRFISFLNLHIYLIRYNTAWDMYHLHHVCIKAGSDGLFYSTEQMTRKLPEIVTSDPTTDVKYN